ncbi:MAG: hypothetical protein AAB451_01100 [Patescibacteria group bacterium]
MVNTKTKIKISLSATIALCLVFIIFLIYPLFEDIKRSSSRILEQKQKLLLLELKFKNLEKFQNRYVDIEPDFKKTETFFVKADLPVEFIRFLEKTSKDSNVATQISLSSGSYQITVAGSSQDFLRFLERLQNSRYLIEIGSFNISNQGKGNINANLSLNVLSK